MRQMQSWFRTAAAVLVLGTLAATAACGDQGADGSAKGPAAGEGEQVDRGGTAVLADLSDINKPMPLLWESSTDEALIDIMYMSLVRGAWRDGEMVFLTADESPMAISRSWEYVGPDSTAIRHHMRSDLKWSDGQPITAADVVWTYRILKSPELASPRQQDVELVDSVVAENDSTVVFHFERRSPEMLAQTMMAPAPRHVYEGTGPAEIRNHPSMRDPASHLVVSGPFRIGGWQPGQQVTLVRNPHFPVQPNLDRIVIRTIPEPTTRNVELQTGRIDFAVPVAFDAIPQLRAQAPNLRFENRAGRFVQYIAWNPNGFPAFADPEIRRALGLAIDVPAIIRALQMEEYTTLAAGPYPPIFKDLHDPERMKPLGFDPERARRILESRGWVDRDGDGIREKDGRPFRFTLLTNSGNQLRADLAQIVQQQLRQVGVQMEIQLLEFNTFMERQRKEDYQAALGGWGVGLTPDLTPLWGKDAELNIVSYDNPEVERLMEQAKAQPTKEKALPYWRAAAERIIADQPYTWLYYYDVLVGVNDRLRGVKVDTYGTHQNTWEWWIPREQQRGAQPRQDTASAK